MAPSHHFPIPSLDSVDCDTATHRQFQGLKRLGHIDLLCNRRSLPNHEDHPSCPLLYALLRVLRVLRPKALCVRFVKQRRLSLVSALTQSRLQPNRQSAGPTGTLIQIQMSQQQITAV